MDPKELFSETNRQLASFGDSEDFAEGMSAAAREALAEAMGQNISTVIGPEIDALRRFRTIGWYYMGGFARLREAALYRIESATSIN